MTSWNPRNRSRGFTNVVKNSKEDSELALNKNLRDADLPRLS